MQPFPLELIGLHSTWTNETNQDQLSASASLIRDYCGTLFNAEVSYDPCNDWQAPSGTQWASLPEVKLLKRLKALRGLRFSNFRDCFEQYDPGRSILHIMFTNWTSEDYNCNYNGPLEELGELGGGVSYSTFPTR